MWDTFWGRGNRTWCSGCLWLFNKPFQNLVAYSNNLLLSLKILRVDLTQWMQVLSWEAQKLLQLEDGWTRVIWPLNQAGPLRWLLHPGQDDWHLWGLAKHSALFTLFLHAAMLGFLKAGWPQVRLLTWWLTFPRMSISKDLSRSSRTSYNLTWEATQITFPQLQPRFNVGGLTVPGGVVPQVAIFEAQLPYLLT